MTVGSEVPLGVGLKEGGIDGTNEGTFEGFTEGMLLGIEEGVLEGVVEGLAEGEELGKAVTSKSRQIPSTSQQTLQHLHKTSAGLSPFTSARQSDDNS